MIPWKFAATATATATVAILAAGAGIASAAERDPLRARAPESVRADRNPVPPTADSIAAGRELFTEIGCNGCHGDKGTGEGPAAGGLDPSPRNFTNPAWQDSRTDGELRYTIFNGSPGTAMIANEAMFDDPDDVWNVINFIRSLKRGH
jgi:mono/diheme cytochrome c family protein